MWRYFNADVYGLSALVVILKFLLVVSMSLMIVSPLLYVGLLPSRPYLSGQFFFIKTRQCSFLLELVVTEHFFFLGSSNLHKASVGEISI